MSKYYHSDDFGEQLGFDDVEGFTNLKELNKKKPFTNESTDSMDFMSKLPAKELKLVKEFAKLPCYSKERVMDIMNGCGSIMPVRQEPPPQLPIKGDGSYITLPPYTRMSDEELINFVKDEDKGNWGRFLAAYSDLEVDAISRKELREYDPRLMARLERLPLEKLNNIIQTTSEKIENTIASPSKEEFQRARQIISRYYENQDITPT